VRRLAGLAILAATLCGGGCVERELRIDSDPPGADVYLDGKLVGKTPLAQPFTFYGGREVTLRKDGYSTTSKIVQIRAPWFQILPLDFVFEVLWPWTLRDERAVSMELAPLQEENTNVLLERAEKWREEAREPAK